MYPLSRYGFSDNRGKEYFTKQPEGQYVKYEEIKQMAKQILEKMRERSDYEDDTLFADYLEELCDGIILEIK